MDVQPRTVALVGLLALVPAVAYAATQPDAFSGVVTAVNVALIVASLAVALRPVGQNVAWG
jgi:hypothetical protein